MIEIVENPDCPFAIDENGCWRWRRGKTNGYGMTTVGKSTIQAHRLFYRMLVGPIPAGLHIHHTCEVRDCVNPAHLRAMTQAENTRLVAKEKRNRAQATVSDGPYWKLRDIQIALSEKLGREISRQLADNYTTRKNFPKPALNADIRLWRAEDIQEWLKSRKKRRAADSP